MRRSTLILLFRSGLTTPLLWLFVILAIIGALLP